MRTLGRALATLVFALMAMPAMSQSLLGGISGTVRDEQGGALPGAMVTLSGKTGSKNMPTDAQGIYRFAALDPGTYEVSGELSGFKPRKLTNISLSVGAQLTIDLNLAVGGLSESLEVVGEAPVVDTSSSATNNTLSQDILFNMPIDRRSFNIYNFAPGVNDSSAYGGGQDTANSLLLDGVDTRDPEGGTDWSFFNYNIIQEVQIQGLGAPAEYGAFTGVIVNTISKSGGNQFAGLFDVNYTKSSLSSKNVGPALLAQNPALADSALIKDYLDFTGQLSGPIVKDKLFFFASTQRFHKAEKPAGPRALHDELSHRFNAKITYIPSSSDTITATGQFDDYNIKGRASFLSGDLLATDEQTVNESAPEFIWNLQWRHLFNANTFLEAKYLGWWGYYDLNPVDQVPNHLDGATGLYTGGAGYFSYSDRTRNEAHVSISHYAEAWGHHEFKFGAEIERSTVRDRYGYVPGGYYYDYGGVPKYTYVYSYDISGHNQRNSAYAQDSWKINDRLTINPGLRYDGIRGVSPALNQTVFSTNSFAPRIGVAYDLAGDHKSVVKAFYGRYFEASFFAFYKRAVPGYQDYVTFTINPDGSKTESARLSLSVPYKVDPNLKQPHVDDFNLSFERAVSDDIRVQVTGIYRKNRDFISAVSPNAQWTPLTLPAANGGTATAYQWANLAATQNDFLITNPDGFSYLDPNGNVLGTARAYRDYKGLQFVVSKRLSHRWFTQASYVLSKAYGTVDSNSNVNGGGSTAYDFQTPTLALVNSEGESIPSVRHEVKVYASYQIPVAEVSVNAYFRSLSGETYTPYQRFTGSVVNFPVHQGRQPFLAQRGSLRLDPLRILDLRLEKVFKVGRGGKDRLGLYADITNVFNNAPVNLTTNVVTKITGDSLTIVGPDGTPKTFTVPFGGPLGVNAPRQLTLAARWSF
jgi:hypothetical protein